MLASVVRVVAQISEASDERVDKLEKLFKPGQQVPGRILGCVCLPVVYCANCMVGCRRCRRALESCKGCGGSVRRASLGPLRNVSER